MSGGYLKYFLDENPDDFVDFKIRVLERQALMTE